MERRFEADLHILSVANETAQCGERSEARPRSSMTRRGTREGGTKRGQLGGARRYVVPVAREHP